MIVISESPIALWLLLIGFVVVFILVVVSAVGFLAARVGIDTNMAKWLGWSKPSTDQTKDQENGELRR